MLVFLAVSYVCISSSASNTTKSFRRSTSREEGSSAVGRALEEVFRTTRYLIRYLWLLLDLLTK